MVEPSVWGPPFWHTLHFVALGYPDVPTQSDMAAYHAFYTGLGAVIPCATCANNYARHLSEVPIEGYLERGSTALFEWTVRMHNLVNMETGKPVMDSAVALRLYSSGAAVRRPCGTALAGGVDAGPNIVALMAAFTAFTLVGALVTFLLMRKRK